jgi:hypothetical protein
MKETLTFKICEMTVYDNYVVNVIKEGITVTPDLNDILLKVTASHFKDKPFVYITHRINSYAVDPQIYYETSKIENLKGFAVVSSDYKAKVNAQIEKLFFKKPFETFVTLEDAFKWAHTLIKEDATITTS